MAAEWTDCTASVSRSHHTDRDGVCRWCRCRVEAPVPKPRPEPTQSQLVSAYRYFFDPDFGSDRDDTY